MLTPFPLIDKDPQACHNRGRWTLPTRIQIKRVREEHIELEFDCGERMDGGTFQVTAFAWTDTITIHFAPSRAQTAGCISRQRIDE
jgi:hypothetical protein